MRLQTFMTKNFLRMSRCLFFIVFLIYVSIANENEKFEQKFQFSSTRCICRPLTLKDLPQAKEVNDSDQRYVSILDEKNVEEALNTQERALHSSDLNDVRKALLKGILYLGVYFRDSHEMLAIIKIDGLYPAQQEGGHVCKHYLGTHAKYHKKYHKKYQNLGFGTEVKRAFVAHFTKIKLIPSDKTDQQLTAFKGFHGLIHLKNKPSLKYNIMNCGYKVGRLIGHRVDVYYPDIDTEDVSSRSIYPPPPDNILHARVEKTLESYLSNDVNISLRAEEILREISLQNIMKFNDQQFFIALDSESDFLVETLARFPALFQLTPRSKMIQIRGILQKVSTFFEANSKSSDHSDEVAYAKYKDQLVEAEKNLKTLLSAVLETNVKQAFSP